MASFSSLRLRGKEMTEALKSQLEKLSGNTGGDYNDARFWYPHRNNDGNASALIRFLPAPEGESDHFVKLIRYDFQGPGGTYKEKSLTTIGKSDPVAKLNAEDWNKGEAGQSAAKGRTQKKQFISNIYVIRDTNHPENEGKVFLYRFGNQMMDMINLAMNPSLADDADLPTDEEPKQPINPFSVFAHPRNASQEEIAAWIEENGFPGANFRVKVKTKRGEEKYADYTDSKFDSPSALGTDEFCEEVWKQTYALRAEFLDPASFKSYEELEKRLYKVLYDRDDDRPGSVSRDVTSDTPPRSSTFSSVPSTSDNVDSEIDEFQRLLDEN